MILVESPLKSRVKLLCYALLKNIICIFLSVPLVSLLTPTAWLRRRHRSVLDDPIGLAEPSVSHPGRLLLPGRRRRYIHPDTVRRCHKTLPYPFDLLAVVRYKYTVNWTQVPNVSNGSCFVSENEYELYKNNDIRPPFTYATLIRQVVFLSEHLHF